MLLKVITTILIVRKLWNKTNDFPVNKIVVDVPKLVPWFSGVTGFILCLMSDDLTYTLVVIIHWDMWSTQIEDVPQEFPSPCWLWRQVKCKIFTPVTPQLWQVWVFLSHCQYDKCQNFYTCHTTSMTSVNIFTHVILPVWQV